jgi:hypothetical protein
MQIKNPSHFYKRISLELSSTWPGEVYLRFEPFDHGPAIMVRVKPGDIVSISQLTESGNTSFVTVPTEDDINEAGIP